MKPPKREKSPEVMSTLESLSTSPIDPNDPKVNRFRQKRSGPKVVNLGTAVWQHRALVNSTPGLTTSPTELPLTEEFSLFEGVYIAIGPTGGGKTLTTAALAAWINATEAGRAAYLQVFEPRAPLYPQLRTMQRQASQTVAKPGQGLVDIGKMLSHEHLFTNPSKFISDVETMIISQPAEKVGVVILDSATDPIKAHGSSAQWEGQTTFPGGMQPSDRDFLVTLATLAKVKHIALILTLNSILLPYAKDLSGATEGIIEVKNTRSFTISDRSVKTKRKEIAVEIPIPFLNATTIELGYGPYKENRTLTNSRVIAGI